MFKVKKRYKLPLREGKPTKWDAIMLASTKFYLDNYDDNFGKSMQYIKSFWFQVHPETRKEIYENLIKYKKNDKFYNKRSKDKWEEIINLGVNKKETDELSTRVTNYGYE